ncbi:MAG: PAS domain S-box protein [Desulfomonilaceae bacterium]|nr:PAS domain S-box protein [Desulfomonilaceae bacterium]
MRDSDKTKEALLTELYELRRRVTDLEHTHRRTEEKFTALFRMSPVWMTLSRADDCTLTEVNQAFLDNFGFSREEVLGRRSVDLGMWNPEQRDAMMKRIEIDGAIRNGEVVLRTHAGQPRHNVINTEPLEIEGTKYLFTVGMDVTDRMRIEEDLRRSDERYRSLVEQSVDGIVVVQGGTVRFANPALAGMFGYSNAQEMEGLGVLKLVSPEYRELMVQRGSDRERGNPAPNWYEFTAVKKDGTLFSAEVGVGLVMYGGKRALQGIIRDITEKKQAEEAIIRSEQRFRSLIDQAADAVFVHDFTGRFLEVNRQACVSLGYTRDELLSMSVGDVDPAAASRGDGDKLWPNLPATFEAHHKRRNGTTFPVEIRLGPIQYGKTTLVLAVVRDITDRKRAEDRLRESEERYRSLAENSLTGICVQQDGRLKYVNQVGAQSLGYSVNELIGRPLWDLIHADDREMVMAFAGGRLRGEHPPNRYQFRVLTKNGETKWVEVMASLIEHEGRSAILTNLMDITDLKVVQTELIEAKDRAEAANLAKTIFLANMSHEFRTPLNAIIGFSEVLEDQFFGSLNTAQMKYVGHVLSSGRHLLDLINNILDLSKVESGRMELHLSPVNLQAVLRDAVSMMGERARNDGIEMDLDIEEDLIDQTVRADETKLRQIMCNLLSNATKFTPRGGEVRTSVRKKDGNVVIRVSDTGIGMKEEDCERIFHVFEQVDSSLARKTAGTGLGLALTRRLVELHGGEITAESQGPNKGSTLTFTIPLMK